MQIKTILFAFIDKAVWYSQIDKTEYKKTVKQVKQFLTASFYFCSFLIF